MRKLLLLLLLASPCFAGTQSITQVPGNYTLPNSAPFNAIGDNTLTIRVHNWTTPGGLEDVFCTPAGTNCLRIDGSGNFIAAIFKDRTGAPPTLSVTGIPDFIARLSRNTTGMVYTLEIFNPATGACTTTSPNIVSLGGNNWSGSGGGFGGGFTSKIAYLRWSTGIPAKICAGMPLETDPPANLLDYEFENNTTDTSPNAVRLTMSSLTYTATPTHPPTCQGQDPGTSPYPVNTIRTNTLSPITWVGCTSESGSVLAYVWTKGTCPDATLSNASAPHAIVNITTRGQCTLNLAVSDAALNTTNITTTFGAVSTNPRGVVQTGDPGSDAILGPMLRYGASSHAFFDDRNQAWAQLLGNAQSTLAYYQDQWNVALPGTITITTTGGVTTVTGVGTDFQNQFCGGGTSEAENTYLIAWTPDVRAVGGTKRVSIQGSGTFTCPSATSIVLSNPYNGVPGGPGLNYSVWTTAGNWVGPSENVNYYDNVVALYAVSERTGMTIFRNYARTLADRWFTMPYFDQGLADCNVETCLMPRLVSYTGMVLRALDGRPEMWPGLRAWTDTTAFELLAWYGDIREGAYLLSVQALCGMVDPDVDGHRVTCRTRVANAIANVWAPNQMADGSWTAELGGNSTYVICTWCGTAGGTIEVTTGSTDAVTTGSGWTTNPFPATCITNGVCSLWITPSRSSPGNNAGGDNQTYHVTWDAGSPMHLTLDRPYDGRLSGSGRGFSLGVLTGFGTQPFMMGVVGAAMGYSYQALDGFDPTNAALAKQFTQDAVKWIVSTGTITNNGNTNYYGLFYARGFTNCETLTKALNDINCSQGLGGDDISIQGIRYLNMEIMHGFCSAYLLSHDPFIRDSADWLFNAAFGPYDSHYLTGYLGAGSFDWNNFHAKTLGFGFGWGLGHCWEAASTFSPSPAGLGIYGGSSGLH